MSFKIFLNQLFFLFELSIFCWSDHERLIENSFRNAHFRIPDSKLHLFTSLYFYILVGSGLICFASLDEEVSVSIFS